MFRVPKQPWPSSLRRAKALRSVLVAALLLGSGIAAVTLSASRSGAAGAGESSSASPAVINPILVVAPSSATVGTSLTFSATGYAHSVAISITNQAHAVVCTGITTAKGLFSCTYVLPATRGGSQNYTGTDAKANHNTVTLTVLSSVIITPRSGLVGTPIKFVGFGFGGTYFNTKTGKHYGFPVEVTWTAPGGGLGVICSTSTSLNLTGTFQCNYTLPASTGGSHVITAAATNQSFSATSSFQVIPGLSAGPTFGPIGTSVTFAGTGFGASVLASVRWPYGSACSGTTLDSGSFSCGFSIPNGTAGGAYAFTATDPDSNSASAAFVVTYLTLGPTGGPVGTLLNLTGGGYAPGHPITVSWPRGSICPGTVASASGTFACSLRIPAGPAGGYLFRSSDDVGDSASATFTLETALTLNVTHGDPGTAVEFQGSGFGVSETASVSWSPAGSPVLACGASTDAGGNFSCPFTIPLATAGGSYVFTATDSGPEHASATFVVTFLTASPASGPRGTIVSLSGGGFAPGAAYSVSWGTFALPSSDCSALTVSRTGGIHCTYTTTYAPVGSHPFTATDVDHETATAAFSVTSALSVAPTSGSPHASTLNFAMSGFAASVAITVSWANGTSVCGASTSLLGAANCSLLLPPSPAGTYVFHARDADSNSASAAFTVTPSLTLSPTSGRVGSVVHFTGRGFGASYPISVTWSVGYACNATSAANGTFVCSMTVPSVPSKSYLFSASDGHGDSASATFKVQPTLVAAPSSGTVGSPVTFSGDGYAPTHRINVTWAGGLACFATSTIVGAFSCAFTVPAAAGGPYVFTARDYPFGNKTAHNSANTTFTILSSLSVSPLAGPVGTLAHFNGRGFRPGTTAFVNWSVGIACDAVVDASGSFSCTYTIPAVAGGSHAFTAGDVGLSATTSFTVRPSLSASPSSGPVGTSLGLSTSGLAAATSLSIRWSGGTACSGTSSVAGSFGCTFIVPPTPAGPYTFSTIVSAIAVANASFTLVPHLALTPGAGPVGTVLAIAGSGFGASQVYNVSSSLGTACLGTTLSNGSFSCGYTVPSAPAGSYTFTARDALANAASGTFTIGPVLSVLPTSGPVGAPIAFRASGFAASTAMTIGWSGGTVCSGTTGPAGRFACNTTAPAAPFGAHTFTATAGLSTTTTFTVAPALTVAPTSGAAGSAPSFTGSGFPALAGISVTWSGPSTCSATTDASGAFSCAVTIPLGTAGAAYAFSATDGHGAVASTTFTVVTGLSVVPGHGPTLTAVSVVGTNFPTLTAVTVTDPSTTICSTSTNASGGFSCPYTIPSATAGGPLNFTATTATVSASALFVVSFLATAPNGLSPGESTNLSGGGFAPGAAFTVTGPWGTACTGTADPAGSIACSASVPVSQAPGEYTFSASDSFSDSASVGFGVLSVAAPTAAPSSADVGEPVTFSVVAAGGGALGYVWSGLPSGCVGSGSSFGCTPTAPLSAGSVTVRVSDSLGFATTSPVLTFTVFAAPGQAPPIASPASVDVGHPVTFTANVSGGSGGGSYAWSAPGLGCAATTGAVLSCTPPTAGPFSVSYAWTDSNGVSATGSTSLSVTIAALPTQAPATPSRASADVGQTVTFTAVVTGGSGGGSYAWSSATNLQCSATTGSVLSCTPNAAGTGSVSYAWTDSDGNLATGTTSLSYTVYGDPSVGVPTAAPGSVDVGGSVTFGSSPTGGSGGYSFSWSGLPTGCAGTTASITCSPSAPLIGGAVSVTVTDSNGFSVSSLAVAFTVFPDPTVATPTATSSSVDVGGSVTFSVVASNGSGGFHYLWSGLPSGCASTAASFTCAPTAVVAGAAISVTVTDSNGVSVTSTSLSFTVFADPTQAPPTPSRPATDVNASVTFTASTLGGSGGGSYSWTAVGLGCAASTGAVLSCTPTTTGTFSVSFSYTDSNGVAATGSTSLSFVVNPAPSVGTPTPSPASVDIGQSVTFSASMSGGSGSPSFVWIPSGGGLGCVLGNASTLVCAPTAAGTYTVSVRLVDAAGVSTGLATSADFTVFADPVVSVPSPSQASADVAQTFKFTTSTLGGSGGLTYHWTLPAGLGCTASTTSMVVCAPVTAGNYTVSVSVTDSNGFASAAETSASFTVHLMPSVTTPIGNRTSSDIGQAVGFATTGAGGSTPYTFTWTVLGGLGCAASTGPSLACVPTATGTYTVEVEVTDASGDSSTIAISASFAVYPDPTATVPTPSTLSADVGQSVTFTTVGGGHNVVSYTWYFPLQMGCTDHHTAALVCKPTAPGNYTVNVTSFDSNHVTSAKAVGAPYTIWPRPIVVVAASSSSFLQGHSVVLAAAAALGSGVLTLSWKGLPGGCTAPPAGVIAFSCTPKTGGIYKITVTATDPNSATGQGNVTINVQPAFLGLPATLGYSIVAAVVLGGLAAVIFFVVRRQRLRRGPRLRHEF